MANSLSDQVVYDTYQFDAVPSEKIRQTHPGLSANSDNISDRLVHGYGIEAYDNPHSDRLVHGCGVLGNGSASSDRLVHNHGNPPTEADNIAQKENDATVDTETFLHRQSLMTQWHQKIAAAERAQQSQVAEWESQLERHGGLDNLQAMLVERVNRIWGKHRKRMRFVGGPERCVAGSVLPATLQKEVEECSNLYELGSARWAPFVITDTVIKLYTLGCLKAKARDGS